MTEPRRPSNRFRPESIVPAAGQVETPAAAPAPPADPPPAAAAPFIPPAPVKRGPRVKVNLYLDPETAARLDKLLRELSGPGVPMGRIADIVIGHGMADVERLLRSRGLPD